jgi:ERCC4-related helicase
VKITRNKFITHALIEPNRIEKRQYQMNIYEAVKDTNSLVVLPTGLGKTIIAVLVLADKLVSGKKVLFLAPTKPLCEQHASFIRRTTILSDTDVAVVTGETSSPRKRDEIYKKAKVVVATPQTIENDLDTRLSLNDYGLIIFDEVHRTVGDYAYVRIIEKYRSVAGAQVLGLTASPGSDFDQVEEVAITLGIRHIEVRNEWDDDVRPYMSRRSLQWYLIDMPADVMKVMLHIDGVLRELLKDLGKYSRQATNLAPDKLSKKAIVEIQQRMQRNLGKRGGYLYHGLSIASGIMKLSHLKDMVTSQGVDVAKTYLIKLDRDTSRGAKRIQKHPLYQEIKQGITGIKDKQPKLTIAKTIIQKHLEENNDARIMVFAEYRDTVEMLLPEINTIVGVRAVHFIGQTTTATEKGMSQVEQKQTLDSFRMGTYNVLISTSIGEEGIDIPTTSLVLFYEPVPSAIRHIQRKGRTARDGYPGKVMILIMKGSRDEAYYWSSVKKEKKMYRYVYQLKDRLEGTPPWKRPRARQSTIEDYVS